MKKSHYRVKQINVLPKHYFKCFKKQKINLKFNCKANKFSKTTNTIHSNHLQLCQSMPPFVFAVLFKPRIHVLSGYIFFGSLSLVAVLYPQYPLFEF